MWAYGFMQGIELYRKDWQPFFDNPESANAFRPIYLLGSDDVTPEEETYTGTPEQSEELAQQVPESLAWIYRFWIPYRQAVAPTLFASIRKRCVGCSNDNNQRMLWCQLLTRALHRKYHHLSIQAPLPISDLSTFS